MGDVAPAGGSRGRDDRRQDRRRVRRCDRRRVRWHLERGLWRGGRWLGAVVEGDAGQVVAVEPVEVDAPGDAYHRTAVAVLPEGPAVPAPVAGCSVGLEVPQWAIQSTE